MTDRIKFTEKLAGVLQMATEQDDRITIEEVEKYFEEDCLNDEQMGLVCEYLMSQKIAVSGYHQKSGNLRENEKSEESVLSREEQLYVERYLQEVSSMSESTEDEAMLKHYLPKIVQIAVELHQPDVYIGDMIQEGSMRLMIELQKTGAFSGIVWEDEEEDAAEGPEDIQEEKILDEVRAGIDAMVEMQAETKMRDKKMVNKASELDEVITKMNDEYGRKVAIDEVAERLGITEDEISDILKLAGEEAPTETE